MLNLPSLFGAVAMAAALSLMPTVSRAAELPKKLTSSVCRTPPTIDGIIGDDEWKNPPAIEFDMPVLHVKAQKVAPRACRLHVMNSANGLYVALRVPDATLNKTLAPLDFDMAMLAFCRGKELAAGDDRKVVGPGIYIDKHLTGPGKDADDARQNGKAAMMHDKDAGIYTIEWAVPLDSKDDEDLRAQPGDSLRFNIGYFDAFQPDLKETAIGAAYAGGLDNAAAWGTIALAADVVDDGDAAFTGPAWVKTLFESFRAAPANRLRLIESSILPADSGAVVRVLVEYPYRDPRGKEVTGKAKLYLPAALENDPAQRPLYYGAGYELDDVSAAGHVARGFVVATPRALEANPLVRTINPDTALLHIARSLPFVDDARTIVAGGSAGGYATLMIAGETFPLAGAIPDVPPVNWGYNAAYFLQRERPGARDDAKAPTTPVFDVIVPIVQQAQNVYGEDTSSETYFRHSPLAHLDTITCPVSVCWTTADMLVPIDQVGTQWIRPFDAEKFPAGFTFNPEKLTSSKSGRLRFADLLPETEYELFMISEETIKQQDAAGQSAKPPFEMPVSADRRWTVVILDEGPPEPQVGHLKYVFARSQRKSLDHALAGKIAAKQLTPRKLERLLDRYAGREWLATELVHLDAPECEQADVLRGLRTYANASPANARQLAELIAKLPAEKQPLGKELLRKVQHGGE